MENEVKFAVLIDADNITNKYAKVILDEVANHGVATYKRIYGDWTNPSLVSWKSVLLDNSITPIQQYGYTVGKSATDSNMIIDAMDILYSDNVDGFCIVSSDSDFTRLAARLRESGMTVIGMGESKTPKPFIAACNQFKYLDVLFSRTKQIVVPSSREVPVAPVAKKGGKKATPTEKAKEKERMAEAEAETLTFFTDLETIKKDMAMLVEECSDEEGWMFSGDLGNQLAKRYADFDVRNYGYQKLTPFIKSLNMFEIKTTQKNRHTNVKIIYVRLL